MGYFRHDAIIVTGQSPEIETAKWHAVNLGLRTTNIVSHAMNMSSSFLIVPDGSKEGWVDSDLGDEARASWIAWTRVVALRVQWVAVSYAGDGAEDTCIVDSEPRRES